MFLDLDSLIVCILTTLHTTIVHTIVHGMIQIKCYVYYQCNE